MWFLLSVISMLATAKTSQKRLKQERMRYHIVSLGVVEEVWVSGSQQHWTWERTHSLLFSATSLSGRTTNSQ
jgi:hypothetical protein